MGMRRVLDRLKARMQTPPARHPSVQDPRELQRLIGFLDDLLVVAPQRHAPEVAGLVAQRLA
eukprot:4881427-Karenia_brevis.AAC.1